MKSVALKAYAKVNLGLAVIGRRTDGFHELRTVYQSISLADDIEVSLSRGPRSIDLQCSGIEVPAGGDNLAQRAAEAVTAHCNIDARVRIRLNKCIPTGSGLGGGSSDAAAVIRGLLAVSRKEMENSAVLRIASSLGSDVPFFLFGGTALGVGRGEEIYPLPEPARRSCVVIFPGVSISTREAYARLNAPLLTTQEAAHNIELFCSELNSRGATRLSNDFERVAFELVPSLADVKQVLLRCGASQAALSGSGSAVFGLFDSRKQATLAAERLSGKGLQVLLTRTVSRREFAKQIPGTLNRH
jgi:4-diphosphocytidyl-2-C-methyl-D-erythritol kinase